MTTAALVYRSDWASGKKPMPTPTGPEVVNFLTSMEDRGNQVVITTASIFGVKKTAFTIDGVSRDFGVVAIDTACTDPS